MPLTDEWGPALQVPIRLQEHSDAKPPLCKGGWPEGPGGL